MKKLIGIADTCADDVAGVGINYSNAVLHAGYLPVVIPCMDDAAALRQLLSRLDGVLLPGGGDISPALYGAPLMPWNGPVVERRDSFEYLLLDMAVSLRLPIVGICRGMQLINAYFGGTLYQDLQEEWRGDATTSLLKHQRPDKPWEGVHDISILPGSHLHRLLGSDGAWVNSTHHQAVRVMAPGFVSTAKSPDGIIEAMESTELPILTVQFHPERLGELGGNVLQFFG